MKKFVTSFITGFCVSSGTLSVPNADNGGYKVHPPVKICENVLIKNVNAITSVNPIMISIQFGSVRRNELRNSLMK